MSDVKDWVQRYINEGWSPIPIPSGEKGPRDDEWEQKIGGYTIADFADDSNVGVHLGVPVGQAPPLYDVDLDAKEAIIAADILLPDTARVSGRPGKPRSHRFYTCDTVLELAQYTGLGGANDMLIELRGRSKKGSPTQTVIPPSLWKSKDDGHTEDIEWAIDQKPLHFPADRAEVFQHGVRNAAIAALLGRHFPGPGNRHVPRMALAGYLHRAGLDERVILMIGKAVMRIIRGDEKDWHDTARSTIEKLKAGDQSVTGGPKLAEAIGADGAAVVKKINQWLGRTDQAVRDDVLERMNAKHFWVRIGKDDMIGREDDPAGVVFQRPRALYSEYANQLVITSDKKGNPREETLFELWLKDKRRRSYDRVVFAPPPRTARASDYNLWRDYAIKPSTEGDCSVLLEHIYENICSGNEEHHKYLMNYLAVTVQAPGWLPGVAIVLKGETATGKGVFVRNVGAIFGRRHYVQLDKPEQFAGKFNAALSGKIVVFADEAYWSDGKHQEGPLKRLITEPTLHIERKGIDGVDEDNFVHLFMATNEERAFPAMAKERRAFIINVGNKRLKDTKYFGELQDQLDAGGLAKFVGLLMEMDVDLDLVRRPPSTDELGEQQRLSLSNEHEWWHSCLLEGSIGPIGWPDKPITTDKFFDQYIQAMNLLKRQPRNKESLMSLLSRLAFVEPPKPATIGGKSARVATLLSLGEARKRFDAKFGRAFPWDEEGPLFKKV